MIQEPPIILVGFGSQAKAWALNLKDSNRSFKIALNSDSHSKSKVLEMGFEFVELGTQELLTHSIFLMLIPDDKHLSFFKANHSFLKKSSHFVYAHGFSLSKDRLHEKYPAYSHSLLAPKAIASDVRFQYETKGKIGAAFYAQNSDNEFILKSLANELGFTALYKSHFDEECVADLFSEQSILCSLIPYGSLKSYNLLRKNGVSSEIAFMECFLELKSITQAFVNLGPQAFFKLISPNALIGSQKGRELLMGKEFDHALEQILIEIKNKQFYKEVEIDANLLRQKVLAEWDAEELSDTFIKLKPELI